MYGKAFCRAKEKWRIVELKRIASFQRKQLTRNLERGILPRVAKNLKILYLLDGRESLSSKIFLTENVSSLWENIAWSFNYFSSIFSAEYFPYVPMAVPWRVGSNVVQEINIHDWNIPSALDGMKINGATGPYKLDSKWRSEAYDEIIRSFSVSLFMG